MRISPPKIGLLAGLIAMSSSGCGLLLGNVKPVIERSDTYGVLDLNRQNPDWKRLPSQNPSGGSGDGGGASDVAYQSEKTASIISLDSACRPTFATEHRDLRSFTDQLFLGISDVTQRTENPITVQGAPALETTIMGKLNGESTALKAVVLHRGQCIYDLMYVSRPEHFLDNQPDFSQFVASLRLKE